MALIRKTQWVAFMGKDNISFHTLTFPAMLMASGQPYILPSTISATHYLMYCGQKFSKSRNVGIFGDMLKRLPIPIDFWRYYLLRIRPETDDSNFDWSDFESKITSELLNNLGNFIFRTLSLCRKIKTPFRLSSEEYQSYQTQVSHLVQNYETSMQATRFRRALDLILELGCLGNQFLQRTPPWTFSP